MTELGAANTSNAISRLLRPRYTTILQTHSAGTLIVGSNIAFGFLKQTGRLQFVEREYL